MCSNMAAAQVAIQSVIPLHWGLSRIGCSRWTSHSVILKCDKCHRNAAWRRRDWTQVSSPIATWESWRKRVSALCQVLTFHKQSIHPTLDPRQALKLEYTDTLMVFSVFSYTENVEGASTVGLGSLHCNPMDFRQITLGMSILREWRLKTPQQFLWDLSRPGRRSKREVQSKL